MPTPLSGAEPPDEPPDGLPEPPWARVPPTEEELCGLAPDPDTDPPGGTEAWLADLAGPVREEWLDACQPLARPTVFAARFLPRGERGSSGTGSGFGSGEPLDTLEPGPALGGFTAAAWERGLDQLTEDELIGVLTAWRRLASWATAGELATVTELTERRRGQAAAGGGADLVTYLPDELAVALTLTKRSATAALNFACGLARLPRTRAALASGQIDPPRAWVIVDEVSALDNAQAARVEQAVIGSAPGQTTGQLRAAVRRAVLAVDPAAADRRRKKAEREARVEVWTETSGTAALAGRDLPPAEVLAADKRVDALARRLRADGAPGPLDLLRARVYTALLLGRPIESLLPSRDAAGERAHAGEHARPGKAWVAPAGTGPAGTVNLTMPLATWLGMGNAPGEVAGYGPVDGDTCRTLGSALASPRAGNRWCLTLTDEAGRAVAHGCTRQPPAGLRWALTVKLAGLAPGCGPPQAAAGCHSGGCHTDSSPGYRPSSRLRHLIETRHRTCSFRGCRRAATRCDLDHTIPHHLGGATCRCNLAPLCRRHHQAKQTEGWHLDQPEPGVLVWTLPHGRRYRVVPGSYPVG